MNEDYKKIKHGDKIHARGVLCTVSDRRIQITPEDFKKAKEMEITVNESWRYIYLPAFEGTEFEAVPFMVSVAESKGYGTATVVILDTIRIMR